MKGGAENRKKTITAGALGAGALVAVFIIYNQLFGGSTPPPPQKPVIRDQSPAAGSAKSTSGGQKNTPGGAAAGVDAEKLASTSASLDPTLDESAMLRTESLLYSGTGRNIFSATYTPPPPPTPKVLGPVRPNKNAPPPLPPMPVGPPPPPPINLKFFGTAKQVKQGMLQAFLLSGDDVYLAGQGDIVARRYKVGTISENSVQVTDLQNSNTQMLPKMN